MRKGGELSKLLPPKHRPGLWVIPPYHPLHLRTVGACEEPRSADPKLRISMTQGINRISKKSVSERPLSIV